VQVLREMVNRRELQVLYVRDKAECEEKENNHGQRDNQIPLNSFVIFSAFTVPSALSCSSRKLTRAERDAFRVKRCKADSSGPPFSLLFRQ